MPDLSGGLLSIATGAIVLVLGWWQLRRTGLTDIQQAAQRETTKLIQALKDRVALLEAENLSLKDENSRLEKELDQIRQRVGALEEALADAAISRRKPPRS